MDRRHAEVIHNFGADSCWKAVIYNTGQKREKNVKAGLKKLVMVIQNEFFVYAYAIFKLHFLVSCATSQYLVMYLCIQFVLLYITNTLRL
jgi:hypothetical protein